MDTALELVHSGTNPRTLTRSTSSYKVPKEEWYSTSHGQIEAQIQAEFVRKVYGILAMQMTITFVMCLAGMFVPPFQSALIGFMAMPMAQWIILVPTICVLCGLHVNKSSYPLNYQLLVVFTVLMSISIAGICAAYQAHGRGMLIAQAFAMTMAVFGGLSAYALKTGQDFEWMGGVLFAGLCGMTMFSFCGWLFGFSGGMFYPLFGVILFSGYILYDTHRLLHIYGPDDALIASIELYLDILNMFVYMLELLGNPND